ncbi:MAG: hypothetical protein HXX17_14165 [Geobacteraceae bacterium]|nr:hypothetical protein [Geobacteraceae bacterium]
MMNIRSLLLLCAVVTSLSACGGGGGGGDLIQAPPPTTPTTVVPGTQALAAGTYKLTFSAISSARLLAPISGIDVAVKFPAGLSVSTVTGGGTGQITSTSITPGSAILATSLAFGNYSASTRTAYLSMATSQDTFRSGQFLNLLFTVASGTTITPNDIYALNVTYPTYKVIGLDTVTHSTVTMTGSVLTTLGVER